MKYKAGLSLVHVDVGRLEVQIRSDLNAITSALLDRSLVGHGVHMDHFLKTLVRADVVQVEDADERSVRRFRARGGIAEGLQNDCLVSGSSRNNTLNNLLCGLLDVEALFYSLRQLAGDVL